jgi:hypothetical protein
VTAREKFRDSVGLYGVPGARITLTDEETGEQLAVWPDDSPDVVSGPS